MAPADFLGSLRQPVVSQTPVRHRERQNHQDLQHTLLGPPECRFACRVILPDIHVHQELLIC